LQRVRRSCVELIITLEGDVLGSESKWVVTVSIRVDLWVAFSCATGLLARTEVVVTVLRESSNVLLDLNSFSDFWRSCARMRLSCSRCSISDNSDTTWEGTDAVEVYLVREYEELKSAVDTGMNVVVGVGDVVVVVIVVTREGVAK
jgi:hypothetical protein